LPLLSHLIPQKPSNSAGPPRNLCADKAPRRQSRLSPPVPSPSARAPRRLVAVSRRWVPIQTASPLDRVRADATDQVLTTNQGVPIADNQNSLRAGDRGPSLLEDFILREKITHFDHERIPERVVHARGAAAHGYFQVYESMANVHSAAVLRDPSLQSTPVFVRFSTVGGSRGSADTPRDVRGFAVKFYTPEGIFDSSATTCRCSSSRTRSSFPTSCTRSSPNRTTRYRRPRRRTTRSGISSR
jgi:catalase